MDSPPPETPSAMRVACAVNTINHSILRKGADHHRETCSIAEQSAHLLDHSEVEGMEVDIGQAQVPEIAEATQDVAEVGPPL